MPDITPAAIKAELDRIAKEIKAAAAETTGEFNTRLSAIEQAVVNVETTGMPVMADSVGQLVVQAIQDGDAGFERLAAWNVGSARFKFERSLKASLTNEGRGTSDDTAFPSQPEQRGIVPPVLRPTTALDVIPWRPTTADTVECIQFGHEGDAGEQLEEGSLKERVDFEGTPKRNEIATIAAWTPASRQVLADHGALMGSIDRVLRHLCRAKLEHLIIRGGTGSGGSSRISGLMEQKTDFIPVIGGPAPDVIGEAITEMLAMGYMPSAVLMHPLDWHRIAVSKSSQDEIYLFGSPAAPIPPALWNVRVVRSPSVPGGSALIVDTAHVDILDRQTPSVMLSNSHEDFFTRNLIAILGELRAGLEVRDTRAVVHVDIDHDASSN